MTRLSECKVNQSVKVIRMTGDINTRRRLVALGILPDTPIKITRFAPLGDPMEIWLRHYSLSLRLSEAEMIEVEVL